MGPWRRGSASRSQREGRGSESRRLHQTIPPVARLTRHPCGTDSQCMKQAMGGTVTPPISSPRGRGCFQVAGSNPARGSWEASIASSVRRIGRPGARRHGRLPLRRWCNGKHGGLQNRRSGFESRPACDATILLFGPSGLRLRKRMATVSECGAVGSARGWGPRGRGFESRHSDARKPTKTEFARMRVKYAAWLERDRRLSRLAAKRRRRRLEGEQRGLRPVL